MTEGCSRLQVITSSPGLRPRPPTTILIPSVVFCWSVISWGVALMRPAIARRAARNTSSRFWFTDGAVGPDDSMANVSWTAAMTVRGQGPCQPVLKYVSDSIAGGDSRFGRLDDGLGGAAHHTVAQAALQGLLVCFGGGSSSQFSSLKLVGSHNDTGRRSRLSSATRRPSRAAASSAGPRPAGRGR